MLLKAARTQLAAFGLAGLSGEERLNPGSMSPLLAAMSLAGLGVSAETPVSLGQEWEGGWESWHGEWSPDPM